MNTQPQKFCCACVVMLFMAAGCSTPEGREGSVIDGLAISTVMLPGAVVASPVMLLKYGGYVIGEGTKERIYAKPGTTEADFESAICKVERVNKTQLRPEINHQRDDTYRSIYRFEKRVYCGRFTQDEVAVKY